MLVKTIQMIAGLFVLGTAGWAIELIIRSM